MFLSKIKNTDLFIRQFIHISEAFIRITHDAVIFADAFKDLHQLLCVGTRNFI